MLDDLGRRLRALGYTRTSTEDQLNRPEDDERRIDAACVAHDFDLVDVLRDEGVSGDVPLASRRFGTRIAALLDGRKPEADVIVVTNIDRLTRDPVAGMAMVERLANDRRRNRVSLLSIEQGLDLSTPHGAFMARQFVIFASYEKDMIRWRTSSALKHRRSMGRVYGAVPYGWDRVGDHSACQPKKCECRLVPNDYEQGIIAQMRDWREDNGQNDGWIADWLNVNGIPGKQGGLWYATSVHNTLRTARLVATKGA